VAREVGVGKDTVRRTVGDGANRNSSEMRHELPMEPPIWQKLDELASGPAQNWASALRALRLINEQVPVDDLFAERFGIGRAAGRWRADGVSIRGPRPRLSPRLMR
jgi:hypothetical protein